MEQKNDDEKLSPLLRYVPKGDFWIRWRTTSALLIKDFVDSLREVVPECRFQVTSNGFHVVCQYDVQRTMAVSAKIPFAALRLPTHEFCVTAKRPFFALDLEQFKQALEPVRGGDLLGLCIPNEPIRAKEEVVLQVFVYKCVDGDQFSYMSQCVELHEEFAHFGSGTIPHWLSTDQESTVTIVTQEFKRFLCAVKKTSVSMSIVFGDAVTEFIPFHPKNTASMRMTVRSQASKKKTASAVSTESFPIRSLWRTIKCMKFSPTVCFRYCPGFPLSLVYEIGTIGTIQFHIYSC